MWKRIVSTCIITILACSIYGCAQTVEETSVAETETVETNHTETAGEAETEFITNAVEQIEQAADNPVPQDEPEPEKEIDFDGSDTHRSILAEYERAWEDETYSVEEWQDVAGVFITLTDPKLNAENYTLYYSISDLSGDGTEELIIGVKGEDGIAPCFLYTHDGERIHMTSSRAESDLVNIPTMLYENGIIESTDYVKNKYGIHRYNFYQLPKESGKMKLIDLYFYTKDSENGTQYYKGDMSNPVTEEAFWNGINDYESLTQIELDWNELKGFWKPGKDDAKTSVIGEEHGQGEKVEEAESKNDELITVMTRETEYYSDGSFKRQEKYEYDSAGNRIKRICFNDFDSIYEWCEYEYDSEGNEMKGVCYNAEGSIAGWWEYEYEYDSAGNKVKRIRHDVLDWSEYEYDSAGNEVKYIHIRYGTDGRVLDWSEYEYDSVGNTVKWIRCDADGSVEWVNEYKYDSAGNRVKCIAYDADGNSYICWEKEYDSVGNEMWYINYNTDGSIRYWEEYEYDSAGNEVKSIEYGPSGNSWYEFGYDNAGNRTSYIGYSISSNIHIWEEFEYDSAGNWTKVTDCRTGQWTEREYITITPQKKVPAEISYEMPDWLAAYVDYIEGMESYDPYDRCSLIYVDEDDIPELVIDTGIYETGCLILTFYDGEVDVLQTGGLRFRYIQKTNLLCATSGQAGEYTDRIYSIENGKWTYVTGGKYVSEIENGLHIDKYSFEWEGEKVEEELYWESLNNVFDEEQAIIPKKYILCDRMLSLIQSGDLVWTPEDEQDAEEDRGEVIADFEYSDEYIPISNVDFASYQSELSKEDWQVLSSFFPILLEGKTFMAAHCPYPDEYTDDIKEQNINDMYASWGFPEYPDKFVLESFTLCDLTGDGQKELIVYSDFAIGLYCVFHKEGDDFYAVYMPIRWFELLQENGIYLGSGGAGRSYFNRLHFLRNVFWEEQVAMYDGDYYEIGGEEVSVAEFGVWEDEMMVGEAVWYDARADWN